MSFFITKKSKHAMKERRKKKLLAERGLLPQPPSLSTTSKLGVVIDEPAARTMTNGNNKRLRSETRMEEKDGSKTTPVEQRPQEHNHQDQSAIVTTTTTGSNPTTTTNTSTGNKTTKKQNSKHVITITIPSNLSSKEVKKFRKDQRRQLLRHENDNNTTDACPIITDIQFVLEGVVNHLPQEPMKKKPKRIYPCINDLVRQQQQQQQQQQSQENGDSTTLLNEEPQSSSTALQHGEGHEQLDEAYTSQFVALDCEMVGIGNLGRQSALARVSIVDWQYNVLLDTYVQVPMKVTDYRTAVSGIKPKHIQSKNNAMDVTECRTTVANLLQKKILIGHALKNDLHALMLTHPVSHIRDTAKYRPFQRLSGNSRTGKWRPKKLRDLVYEHCNALQIQQPGQSHNSIDDASATMKLYQTVHTQWELELSNQTKGKKKR